MGRRILAFFLGFIFAFVCIGGAIAIAIFAIKIDQMAPITDNYLGDLAHMSIYDMGQSLYQLYADKKTWKDENGKYYSLGDFCENYHIDLNAAFGGVELPQEVLDIPAFEFFNEGGMENAMKQIKVSAFPALMNMFGGKNEDGTSNALFGDSVMAEFAKFSMYDLLANEEVGISGVFANIRFAELLPDAFPAEDSDNKLMWAVGQTKIGGLLDGMSGSESILLQLKSGGAFETLGNLELSIVLGESQYVSAILGSGAIFADLIADDGTVRLDDIINGVSIGELLGCQKNEILELEGYAAIDGQDAEAVRIMQKVIGEEEAAVTVYVMSANGENWFEAELKCDNVTVSHVHNDDCYTLDCEDETEEHEHNSDCYKLDCGKADGGHIHSDDCFKYVWYSTGVCNNTEHNHVESGDMLKDGNYYPRTDGLYAILAGLSITDFTSGDSEALMNELKVMKVRDIINIAQVDGVMDSLVDLTIEQLMNGAIDELYLGEFFNFKRTAIQDNSTLDIENAETIFKTHNSAVRAFYVTTDADGNVVLSLDKKTWYAAEFSCDDPENHTETHTEYCYSYVWWKGENLRAEGVQNKLASRQISDLKYLNDDVRRMTLNDVFGESIPSVLKAIANVRIGELNGAVDQIQLGELLGYESELICEDASEDHVHKYSCYVWTDKNGETVTGMMAKLAIKRVGDLSTLTATIQEFTLRDVLNDAIPDMLKSLADTEIGNLNEAINNMYIGDFLEYERNYDCEGGESHEHDENCVYVWIDKDGNEVTGMMSKVADKKINELSTMDSIVQELTLRDVLGDSIPAMLLDVADKKVSEVGDAIEDIYLGSALGYYRKALDATEYTNVIGNKADDNDYLVRRHTVMTPAKYIKREIGSSVWYEAVMTCKLTESETSGHEHNANCYDYVWYEDETCSIEVTGMIKAFVNTKVGGVNDRMNSLTLGDLGIGSENTILKSLQDTPVSEIGTAINEMKMAVVLGYEKYYTCGETHKTHEDSCDYIWIAECTHDHATATDHSVDEHMDINGKNYYAAKGLNAKIAEKTVEDMTGDTLTEIALGLTIGELIDTGMISLGENAEENSYKLALLFSNGQHSFSENVFVGGISQGEKTLKCNLTDYALYKTYNANITTKQYWDKCHQNSGLSAEELSEHTFAWKNLTLKEFVAKLLEAF